MKRNFLSAALLAAALSGCGGGEPAVDDTASPAVDGIPRIEGETTAEAPGGDLAAPATGPASDPGSASPDPGAPPPPPSDPAAPPPAGSGDPAPPVTPPTP